MEWIKLRVAVDKWMMHKIRIDNFIVKQHKQ